MDAAAPRQRPARRVVGRWPARTLLAWFGASGYVLVIALLTSGSRGPVGPLGVLGSLLAVSLLVGVVRRAPLAALALTTLGAVTLVFVRYGPADRFMMFLAVDMVLGVLVATRGRWMSLGAVVGTFLVQVAAIVAVGRGPEQQYVLGVIAALAMTTSCMIGLLSRQRRAHAATLRARAVREAVTAERLRIARELHDMVAHSIGIIAIQAGVGSRVIHTQPVEAGNALRAIETTSREALAGLRRTLVALRHADDRGGAEQASLAPAPGLADLGRLGERAVHAGVRVEVRVDGQPRPLPADIDLSAYRIVQEAVTNVVRHAGVRCCQVRITYAPAELTVEVVDDGQATPTLQAGVGFGITGMRERTALLHGRLRVGPRPGGGFQVLASLPLPQPHQMAARRR